MVRVLNGLKAGWPVVEGIDEPAHSFPVLNYFP